MQMDALLGLVFLGLASHSFAREKPHAPTSHDVKSSVASQPPEEDNRTTVEGATFPNFKPSEFPFVTTLPDDGAGKGGGWQVAKANLEFVRISLPITYIKWYCPVTVQMPLRTELRGKISPASAATMSATVANSVAAGIDYKLPQGIFCDRFRTGMRDAFPTMYPGLGARVTL